MFRAAFLALFLVSAMAVLCCAQDPLPVVSSSWHFATQKAEKVEVTATGPARLLTQDDKVFERTVRQSRTDHPDEPSQVTPDGRRATMDKIEQEAKTPQPGDARGFLYSATVRNDEDKTVRVIYWEYRFTEIAHPSNVVRRQFLCSVHLKKGADIELTAFSTLGPTDVIDVDTLARSEKKLFDEQVLVNRIEYSDDSILQRGNWRLGEVKKAVDRATSTPWGKEICRPL